MGRSLPHHRMSKRPGPRRSRTQRGPRRRVKDVKVRGWQPNRHALAQRRHSLIMELGEEAHSAGSSVLRDLDIGDMVIQAVDLDVDDRLAPQALDEADVTSQRWCSRASLLA